MKLGQYESNVHPTPARSGEACDPIDGGQASSLARTKSEFLWVASPKVISAGIQLLVNLLMVRELGPERAGVVFVCITAILLGDAVLGSALDMAVLRLATRKREANAPDPLEVQLAALLLKLSGCLLLVIPVLIWSRSLSVMLFHAGDDAPLLSLSVIALFGLLLLRSVQSRFQISRRFRLYGWTDLLHIATRCGGIGLMLGFHRLTPVGVLALYAAGPVSVSVLMLCTAARDILTARLSKSALRNLAALCKWYVGGAAAGSITSRMDIFVVSAFAGSREAGLFSAAQAFVLPFQMIGMYLGIVFAPRIMPMWEAGSFAPVYRKFQVVAISVSILCYSFIFSVSPVVPAWLLAPSFHDATRLTLLLLPSSLMALVNFPWTVSFLMFTHPRFLMFFDSCAFAVLVVLYWQSVTRFGATGAAIVTSAFALFKTAVLQLLALSILTKHPRPVMQGLATSTPQPSFAS